MNGQWTNLNSIAPYSGGPAGASRSRALPSLPSCHKKELSQPLLHKTSKALVVGLQGGAVYILDHCVERQEDREGI